MTSELGVITLAITLLRLYAYNLNGLLSWEIDAPVWQLTNMPSQNQQAKSDEKLPLESSFVSSSLSMFCKPSPACKLQIKWWVWHPFPRGNVSATTGHQVAALSPGQAQQLAQLNIMLEAGTIEPDTVWVGWSNFFCQILMGNVNNRQKTACNECFWSVRY